MAVKVLIVSGGMNAGGAEKWLLEFIRRANDPGVEFSFLFHSNETQFFENELIEHGVTIHRANVKNPFSYFRQVFTLLKMERFDVVHSHVNHFSAFYSLYKPFFKFKLMVHGHNDLSYYKSRAGLFKRGYYQLCELLISYCADLCIPVSDKAGHSLFTHLPSGSPKLKKIYCGIDLTSIEHAEIQREDEALVQELAALKQQGCKLVFHVGRFVEQKNHSFLIQLAQAAQQSSSRLCFVCFGDGPLKEQVLQSVATSELTNIKLVGLSKSVIPLMKKFAHCLVLPSLHEGLPITLMESQATGVPAVISNHVTAEAAISDGLVTYLSLDANLSNWIHELEKQKRQEDFPSLKNSCFDIERSVQALLALYLSEGVC